MNDVLLMAIILAHADGNSTAADALEKLADDPAELTSLLNQFAKS